MFRLPDAGGSRPRSRDGGHVRNLVLNRFHADIAVIDLRQTADRRIDNQRDLAIFDEMPRSAAPH